MSKKFKVSFFLFNCILSCWCITVYNYPFFNTFFNTNAALWVKMILPIYVFLMFMAIHCLVLYKKTTKPLLYFFLTANAFASYFISRYNVPLNRMIMINIFETNAQEAGEFFDIHLYLYLLWTCILPIIVIHFADIQYPPFKTQIKQRLFIIILTTLIVGGTVVPFKKQISIFTKENFNVRYMLVPTSYVSSLPQAFKMKYFSKTAYVKINKDVKKTEYRKMDGRKNLFIFVLGESARNANFSLTGYARDTCAPLTAYQDNLFVYQKMESCATLTRYALPCIFTHFERKNLNADVAGYTDNVLDIIQSNGYKVKWFENELGCNKMCRNVETKFTCDSRQCYDIELNKQLYTDLPNITQDSFYVLHQRGSHGISYYKRYPAEFEKYEELINAYDNTIYYTNYVLADLIQHLTALDDQYNVVMLYTSDHGESLGENGVYLHGGQATEQREVPFMIWIGDKSMQSLNLDKDCLQKQTHMSTTHDNLFHTFLGLTGLSLSVYKPELDLISSCKIKN